MGPWDNEPNEADFEHAGLKCEMRRNHFRAWCGYVIVPEKHPAHGLGWDAVDVQVHGGVTFAASSPDGWRIGFDCVHLGDLSPDDVEKFRYHRCEGVYRDFEFVRAETCRLAEQLAAMPMPPKYAEADVLKAMLWATAKEWLEYHIREGWIYWPPDEDEPVEDGPVHLGNGPIPDASLLPPDALDRLMAAWEGAK